MACRCSANSVKSGLRSSAQGEAASRTGASSVFKGSGRHSRRAYNSANFRLRISAESTRLPKPAALGEPLEGGDGVSARLGT